MTDDERLMIVQLALGKASVYFMSQTAGRQIVMPVEGLLEVANDIASIWLKDVRERTGAREERGQDVSVEMLQRAAVACRSAAAMWSAIPTKSEYWCETADYFDKRARAAGKGE